jgi:outer membrane lipoprotein-sorting protein
MNADDIINQMARRYSNCQTYQDTGRVEGRQHAMTFSTYFVRPDLFRFDWIDHEEEPCRNSIWSDGLKVFSRYDHGDGVEEEPNIGLAIAGATGISQGAAHTVSTLLLPDADFALRSRGLLKLAPYVLCGSEMEAGESCHRVRHSTKNHKGDLWIRASDFAILKYQDESTSTPEDDEETIAALSQFDPAAAEEMMQYLATRTAKNRHLTTCTWYERIVFDEPIDEAVFKGPNY